MSDFGITFGRSSSSGYDTRLAYMQNINKKPKGEEAASAFMANAGTSDPIKLQGTTPPECGNNFMSIA